MRMPAYGNAGLMASPHKVKQKSDHLHRYNTVSPQPPAMLNVLKGERWIQNHRQVEECCLSVKLQATTP